MVSAGLQELRSRRYADSACQGSILVGQGVAPNTQIEMKTDQCCWRCRASLSSAAVIFSTLRCSDILLSLSAFPCSEPKFENSTVYRFTTRSVTVALVLLVVHLKLHRQSRSRLAMGSFANTLLFIPSMCCDMLATMTSACCSLGMSAGHYLTTLACQTAQTVVHPFIVCCDILIRRYNSLVSCCWTCWSCAYTVLSYPLIFCADLLPRLIKLITKLAHNCNTTINWWLRFALTIITTPWRATYYALCITRRLFTSWAHVVIKLPSCAGTIVPAIWTQLKKKTLQLLWALTPYPCKAVYTWLWPGTRHHSSSPQVSAALGQPAAAPTVFISLFAWPSISLQLLNYFWLSV